MNRTFRWRLTSVIGLILILGYLAAANFVPKAERLESPLWPDEGLRLGLDLQGGIHWVVGVDLKAADQHELEFMRAALETDAEAKNIAVEGFYVRDGELVAEFRDPAAETALRALAEDTSVLDETQASETSLHWQLSRDRRQTIKEQTMAQVLEVLRRRIDDPVRGIPDSVVTRQGDDRVLVEIPGGQIDRARARALLRSTGFLEFKIVIDEGPSEEILRASYPGGLEEGQEIVLEKDRETDQVLTAYLVREEADITGDYLDDARVGFDPQQRPLVNFVFSPDGGLRFRDITRDNLKKKLAIILDDNVYSAPVIQGQISTRGQISGRFSSQEAADLAVVLRAGSLSVPVVIEEERSVGPALGQDSIDQGTRAAVLGMLLTLGFAIGYYRLSGGYAAFALLVNLVLLVGLMSAFEATLTLPGIAGLVLTIGMAVDANVIIFERIREELRDGRSPRAAISAGFKKATWTVLDANITTLITAIILFEFGTGPIKGFAVTLSVGIITSVFSALVVTRMLFHLHPGLKPVERLSI